MVVKVVGLSLAAIEGGRCPLNVGLPRSEP